MPNHEIAPGPGREDAPDVVKAAVRARLRAARGELSADQLADRGEALAQGLAALVPAGSAVAGYVPMPGEPDVRPFLRRHAEGGGAVYVPVIIDPATRVLEWVRWTPEALLRRSEFAAVEEPRGDRLSTDRLRELHPEGLSVLVPGLAVDHQGARMGQGGGFYDTAFGTETTLAFPAGSPPPRGSLRFIAIVHAAEVFAPGVFPVEPHDLHVHAIATERGVTTLRPL